jgi:hypothetical protein
MLTTYTYESELQALSKLSLIPTLHKSLLHLPNLFQPAMSSSAVPWPGLLRMEICQLYSLKSSSDSRTCRTLVNCQLNYSAMSSQHPLQSSTELVAPILFFITSLREPRLKHHLKRYLDCCA